MAPLEAPPEPVAFRDVVAGVKIRPDGDTIVLSGQALQEELVQRIARLEGVSYADSYLEIDTQPNQIIGIAPGSPLRVDGELVELASGEEFSGGSDAEVIVGVRVDSNPYILTHDQVMAAVMAHRFLVGQSFEFVDGLRLRVVGLYRSGGQAAEDAILVPLQRAQGAYGMEGTVTTVVVSVTSTAKLSQVRQGIEEVLEGEG